MFSFCKRLDLRRVVFLVYPSFSTVFFNICELVDGEGVFLVEWLSVELFRGGNRLFGGLVLDKGETLLS
jgi:hypothetical protein